MRIVSWNVNGIRACLKKGLLDYLEAYEPDIFCVQETKAYREQVDLTDQEFGFSKSIWSEAEKKGYSGTATFVLDELKGSSDKIGVPEFDKEGRFVVTEHPEFLLYNIYFPNGAASEDRHNYKMAFLDMILNHIEEKLAEGKDIVVLGDYNIAHAEIDIHDPVRLNGTSGFRPEEREWMDRWFSLGMVDCFREMYPDKKDMYSWWSYRAGARERNKGWRIDYISVSPNLAKKIENIEIQTDVFGSDHCPILLDLKI